MIGRAMIPFELVFLRQGEPLRSETFGKIVMLDDLVFDLKLLPRWLATKRNTLAKFSDFGMNGRRPLTCKTSALMTSHSIQKRKTKRNRNTGQDAYRRQLYARRATQT